MKISIQEYDPQWALCKQVQCEVDETTFTGIRKEVLASFQREAQVDGFRLGKAPLAMVVQKYRPQIQKALQEELIAAVKKDLDTNPEQSPRFYKLSGQVEFSDSLPLEEFRPLSLKFLGDVFPEFELPTYKGVRVQAPQLVPEPDHVEKFIQQLCQRNKQPQEIAQPARTGDYVQCSYAGFYQGIPLKLAGRDAVYSAQKDTWEEAGVEDPFSIPGLKLNLVGASKGDVLHTIHTYPEDFKVRALAGKSIEYKVEVGKIVCFQVPTVEKLAEEMGFSDPGEIRALIEEMEEQNLADQQKSVVKNLLLNQLILPLKFPVTGLELQRRLRGALNRYAHQHFNPETPQEELKEKVEAQLPNLQEEVQRQLRFRFFAIRIAELEDIKVSQKDIDFLVERLAREKQITPQAFMADLTPSDQDELAYIAQEEKVLAFIAEHANVEYVQEQDMGQSRGESEPIVELDPEFQRTPSSEALASL